MASATPPFSFSFSAGLQSRTEPLNEFRGLRPALQASHGSKRRMEMVKAKINGRVFTFAWEEFEKAMGRLGVVASVEILEVA
ncbi:hypothetical protein [Geomonas subterranea]|uniref:hypothetical protein n=1 Tax=Geomonas subterranea TaxID=2847989 RepID=UPI001CD72C9A|nr:hypothetical protein [Geomonas fuzhouensis]